MLTQMESAAIRVLGTRPASRIFQRCLLCGTCVAVYIRNDMRNTNRCAQMTKLRVKYEIASSIYVIMRKSRDKDIGKQAGRGASRWEIRSECSSSSALTSYGMTATGRGRSQDATTRLVHHVKNLGRGGQWPAWRV